MRAKKSLGQNFLNSKTIARDIVRAAELAPEETVLEIGPGKGSLTGELLVAGARVVAVEKDDRMIPLLSETFREAVEYKQLTLVHGDILDIALRQNFIKQHFGGRTYKIVANIPYYITGQILRLFLEADRKPERMILMIQKEVADRIVARDGKESILSIAVKAYGTPRIIKNVHARYFTPAPKVDSAVLAIEHIVDRFHDRTREARFFEIVKAGFAHKRKRLAGNLKEVFKERTETHLAQAGIALNARAEDVTLDQWLALSLEGSVSN